MILLWADCVIENNRTRMLEADNLCGLTVWERVMVQEWWQLKNIFGIQYLFEFYYLWQHWWQLTISGYKDDDSWQSVWADSVIESYVTRMRIAGNLCGLTVWQNIKILGWWQLTICVGCWCDRLLRYLDDDSWQSVWAWGLTVWEQ